MSLFGAVSDSYVATPAYVAAVLADSPLFFGKMDEASGSTMVDSSGNGHDGSYVNSPTLGATGLVSDGGKAVTFNGTNQYANVPGAAWMNTSDYTIEYVLKTTGVSAFCADRDDGVSTKVWESFIRATGAIGFVHFTTGGASQQVNGTTTVTDGVKHHVACVKSGTSLLVYVGGGLEGSGTFSSFATSSSQGLDIARRGNGSSFLGGTLDCVAYYGTALSATRIAAHAALV